ncbi:hypothetical protein RhiirC2_804650, partial [Rhizophagus irregularis]
TKIENTLEITSRSDTFIAKLKDLIYEKKKHKLRTLEQSLDTNAKNTITKKLDKMLMPLYDIGEIFEQSSKNICIIAQPPATSKGSDIYYVIF